MAKRIALLVTCGLAATSCHRLSPTEQRIVGTWYSWTMHGNIRTVFNRDHSLAIYIEFDDPKTVWGTGTWRVEENDLVFDLRLRGSPDSHHVKREKIRDIAGEKLTTDHNEYTRSKLYPDVPPDAPVPELFPLDSPTPTI